MEQIHKWGGDNYTATSCEDSNLDYDSDQPSNAREYYSVVSCKMHSQGQINARSSDTDIPEIGS